MYRKSVTETKIDVLNLSLYIHKQNINFKNLNKIKKMIFSAIALVAFSFAGKANEIDEKKVETVVITRDCFAEAIDFLNRIDPNNQLSDREGARYMNAYIASCEKGIFHSFICDFFNIKKHTVFNFFCVL